MHKEQMEPWRRALRQREGTLYRDTLDETVAALPYWMREKLRLWLREQTAEEPEPEAAEALDYARREIVGMLGLVPKDRLALLVQIVRLFASGR